MIAETDTDASVRTAPRTRASAIFAALILAVVPLACGGDGGDGAEDGEPAASTTTDPVDGSSTTDAITTTTEPPLAGGDLVRCENPEGFAIEAPAAWATNEGDVVPPCSLWDPEPFEVPEATDERVAAISAYVDPVGYADAVAPSAYPDGVSRSVTAVDGRQAVRLAYETDREGLWPEGTPVTTYAVDLTPQDGAPATLFVDTIGLSDDDYGRNQVVLDRMASTIDVTAEGVADDPAVVATFLGGGGGFSVEARHEDGQTCLRIPSGDGEICTDGPSPTSMAGLGVGDLQRVYQAGATGSEVWRVAVRTSDGEVQSFLTVAVPDADTRAFATQVPFDDVSQLSWFDVTGEELGSLEL